MGGSSLLGGGGPVPTNARMLVGLGRHKGAIVTSARGRSAPGIESRLIPERVPERRGWIGVRAHVNRWVEHPAANADWLRVNGVWRRVGGRLSLVGGTLHGWAVRPRGRRHPGHHGLNDGPGNSTLTHRRQLRGREPRTVIDGL